MTVAGWWLAAATLAGAAQTGTLEQATIRILVDETGSTVEADYLVVQPAERVAFNAIRLAGQRFFLLDLPEDGPRASRSLRPGLVRFVFTAARRDTLAVRMSYRVEGATERIPLFVPEAPTNPPATNLQILVTGVAPAHVAPNRVPRFTVLPDGTLRATPDHLPTLVWAVREEQGLSLPTVVQWGVVVIAVAGTLGWAWARRS